MKRTGKIKKKRELIQQESIEREEERRKTAEINRDEFLDKVIKEIPRLEFYNKRLKHGFNDSQTPYLNPEGRISTGDLSEARAKSIAFTQGTRGLLEYVSPKDFPGKKTNIGFVRNGEGLAEHLGIPDIEPNFRREHARSNELLGIIDFLKEEIEGLEARIKKLETKK